MKNKKPLIVGRLGTLPEIKEAIEETAERINDLLADLETIKTKTEKENQFTPEQVEKIRQFFGFK